jgi:hypothetical protein
MKLVTGVLIAHGLANYVSCSRGDVVVALADAYEANVHEDALVRGFVATSSSPSFGFSFCFVA